MNIGKIRITKTLKMGTKYYWEGEEFTSPIPAELISEIAAGSDAIKILEGQKPVEQKVVPSTQRRLLKRQ